MSEGFKNYSVLEGKEKQERAKILLEKLNNGTITMEEWQDIASVALKNQEEAYAELDRLKKLEKEGSI